MREISCPACGYRGERPEKIKFCPQCGSLLEDAEEALHTTKSQNDGAGIRADAEAYLQNGDVFFQLGEYQDGLDAYRAAVKIHPGDYRGWLGAAHCWFKVNAYSKLESFHKQHDEILRKALTVTPIYTNQITRLSRAINAYRSLHKKLQDEELCTFLKHAAAVAKTDVQRAEVEGLKEEIELSFAAAMPYDIAAAERHLKQLQGQQNRTTTAPPQTDGTQTPSQPYGSQYDEPPSQQKKQENGCGCAILITIALFVIAFAVFAFVANC